jgi:hypothetical protein
LLLGQSGDPSKNGGVSNLLPHGTRITLNNDIDTIRICLGPCATGVVLDQVSWDASTLGASYDGHALMVTPGSKQFCPATEPFGTAASFGTPGAPNPPCPTSPQSTDAAADSATQSD